MKIDLNNRTAFVSGSSSGLGQAIAISMAKAGAQVVVHYRGNEEGAIETAKTIREETGRASLIVQGDLSQAGDVAKCYAQIDKELGALDIFVNNAGIDGHKRNLIDDHDLEVFEQVIQLNLIGAARCIQEALKRMKTRESGVILSVTSVHQSIPWAGQAAYCASKAGIAEITRSLALELGDSGIRVLSLAPGAIQTDINRDVWEDPEQLEDLLKKVPQGRMGNAKEIGDLATFLVSDLASYIHGTTVYADGAMTAYPSFAQGG